MSDLSLPGLGRKIYFDPRSRLFPIRGLIPPGTNLRSYTWSVPVNLDQGSVGACVGFAVAHEAAARPVQIPNVTNDLGIAVYQKAQKIDEWDGENYEGTSILAGMKVGQELGWYDEYRWAFGIWDLLLALGYKGPAVLGLNWYTGMFKPDALGYIEPTGTLAGGHAIVATAVSIKKTHVELHNSWGPEWGINGKCYIRWGPLQWLLEQQGEAAIPVIRSGR